MPASYPAGFDVMLEPGAALSGPPEHDDLHKQITDILTALEAELGLNPSGTDATVAALLAALPLRFAPFISAAVKPWDMPWGFVASKVGDGTQPQNTTGMTALAGTAVPGVSMIKNRRYLVVGKVLAASTVVADVLYAQFLINGVEFGRANGINVAVAGMLTELVIADDFVWTTANDSNVTGSMAYGRSGGSGVISGRHDIMQPSWRLMDIGPATATPTG